jgi:hypothetical protein
MPDDNKGRQWAEKTKLAYLGPNGPAFGLPFDMTVRYSGLQKEVLALYRRCVILGLGLAMVCNLAARYGWFGQSHHHRETSFASTFATVSRPKRHRCLPGM